MSVPKGQLLHVTAFKYPASKIKAWAVAVTPHPIRESDFPKCLGIPFVYVKAKTGKEAEDYVIKRLTECVAFEMDIWKATSQNKKGNK